MFVIDKPHTPHNTGQFLIKNFNIPLGKNEITETGFDNFDTDTYQTGGSMIGNIYLLIRVFGE